MRTWSSLMRRMLCLTPWSKSGQPNLEEKQTALKITPVLEDLRLLETKKWLPESMTTLWLTTIRRIATTTQVFFTLWPQNWLWGKVPARWIHKPLTDAQKCIWFSISCDNLHWSEVDPADFPGRFVTMDDTWVHHFTLETKQQSKQWKLSDSPPPKKAMVVQLARKVMASFFFFFWCWGSFIVAFSSEGSYSK